MSKNNKYKAHVIKPSYILFDLARWSGWPFLLWYRIKRIYENKKQKKGIKGGALVVSNHILYSDVMVLSTAFWFRRMHFMVMKEIMANKFLTWFYTHCGCIPVDREKPSFNSIRTVTQLLEGGNVVTVFPEGHVSFKNENPMNAFKSGAVLMAYQANVPIIPVYREVRKSIWHRQKIVVGEPVNLREKYGDKMGMKEIEEATIYLFEKEQQLKALYHEGEK